MSLIHAEGAPAHLGPVQCLLGRFRSGGVLEFDEGEAARTPGLPVADHIDRVNGTMLLKQLSEFCLAGGER
jgi:hypothetical protein